MDTVCRGPDPKRSITYFGKLSKSENLPSEILQAIEKRRFKPYFGLRRDEKIEVPLQKRSQIQKTCLFSVYHQGVIESESRGLVRMKAD